ncbi:hypothetical protein SAMN05421764_104161 [Donghicola eburneus]|uniref:Putative secreted protein n=2 Tax=Roseobacteraceae TaxID=2854170 RepID=A0A1M4N611_9RHOB|nr:putative secreted protein [Donghicola eburneus]SFQ46041.1 hypothetical protein SAMN05421764_104161 [Donghicola eburneus]
MLSLNREDFSLKTFLIAAAAASITATTAFAAGHGMAPMVDAADQSVSNGVVSASKVMAPANGWMVVHRTDSEMKPGPVVGYAPLREGENTDVAAILQEDVATGDMLMLMVHGEDGGMSTGVFEYTLGAKEDGPIKVDDALVMKVITAQ